MSKGFHIKKPEHSPSDAVKAFAAGAADAPLTQAQTETAPIENNVVVDNIAAVVEESIAQFPWEIMDDKVLRTQGYTVQFPASIYSKMKFLGENEPGGPSIRAIVLDALEPYLAEKLAKYGYPKKANE